MKQSVSLCYHHIGPLDIIYLAGVTDPLMMLSILLKRWNWQKYHLKFNGLTLIIWKIIKVRLQLNSRNILGIFRFHRWFCELGINEKSFWYASWKWSEICSYIRSRNTFRSWPWLQTSQGSMASLVWWLYLSLIPFSCYWAWQGRFYSWWRGYSSNRNRIPNQLIFNNCLINYES